MNPRFLMSLFEIMSLILCVVLIFIGLYRTVKALSREDRSREIPKETLKRNTVTILTGIFFFVAYRFCSGYLNLPVGEKFSPLGLALSALLQGAFSVGFTAFLPFLLNRLRAHGARSQRD